MNFPLKMMKIENNTRNKYTTSFTPRLYVVAVLAKAGEQFVTFMRSRISLLANLIRLLSYYND